jgi:hypothetical protein
MGTAELDFGQFLSALPTHLQGGPPTWKEGVRTAIKRAGSRYASQNRHASAKAPAHTPPRSTSRRRRGHAFKPDPSSVASRALGESRRALETAGKTLSFQDLVERLPRDLVATSKQRQYVRLTLQRSGKRSGIDYLDAEHIKLV